MLWTILILPASTASMSFFTFSKNRIHTLASLVIEIAPTHVVASGGARSGEGSPFSKSAAPAMCEGSHTQQKKASGSRDVTRTYSLCFQLLHGNRPSRLNELKAMLIQAFIIFKKLLALVQGAGSPDRARCRVFGLDCGRFPESHASQQAKECKNRSLGALTTRECGEFDF